MNKIKIPKSEFWEIIEDENTEKIHSSPFKHDISLDTYVCKRKDKYYRFAVERSYSNGIQIWNDYIEATEVMPMETKTITWEPVRNE